MEERVGGRWNKGVFGGTEEIFYERNSRCGLGGGCLGAVGGSGIWWTE